MTKREAAIISAYTGYLIGEFKDFHAYAEEVMGRPVFTHELPSIAEELKYKSKKDFMSIKIEEKEERHTITSCDHWECPYYYRCNKTGLEAECCMGYMDI